MTNIFISDLQSIGAELEQLSDLDSEAIVGGLSITGGFCGGIKFVPVKIFPLPNGVTVAQLKPIFIPCNPKPSESLTS